MSEPVLAAEEVSAPPKQYEYRVTLLYKDKLNETIVTVQVPQVNQLGIMHCLKKDRLICINAQELRRWEIEQLGELIANKIIV